MPLYSRRFLSLNILFGNIDKYNKALEAVRANPLRPDKPYRDYEIRENRLFNKKYDLMVVFPTEENIGFILTNEFKDNTLYGSTNSFYKSVIQNKYIGITEQDVNEFFKRQPMLQIQKSEKNAVNKPILARSVNEVWSIDHLDLSMYSEQHKYKYVLVVVDVFSRYMFIEAQTNLTATTTKETLKRIIARAESKPSHILSDNGTAFKEVFDEFLNEEGIKHRRTISHRPQSNGIVERVNLEIRKILKRLMTENKNTQWKNLLPQVEAFYNNRYHSSIKRTPHQVWYARTEDLNRRFNNWEDLQINVETGANLRARAKKQVAKYKRHEYAVGDLCRVEMQTIFSAVRAKVKAGKRKEIIVWWCPTVFRVSRVIERPADLGLEPNLYELQDVETERYLCIPTQRYGNDITVLKQCYSSEMMPVDKNELQNKRMLNQTQALALNGCKPVSTDLILKERH